MVAGEMTGDADIVVLVNWYTLLTIESKLYPRLSFECPQFQRKRLGLPSTQLKYIPVAQKNTFERASGAQVQSHSAKTKSSGCTSGGESKPPESDANLVQTYANEYS
jgi:hypothetical protein